MVAIPLLTPGSTPALARPAYADPSVFAQTGVAAQRLVQTLQSSATEAYAAHDRHETVIAEANARTQNAEDDMIGRQAAARAFVELQDARATAFQQPSDQDLATGAASPDARQRFRDAADAIAGKYTAGLSDRQMQQFSQSWDWARARAEASFDDEARQDSIYRGVAGLQQSLDAYSQAAMRATDVTAERDILGHATGAIDQAVNLGLIRPDQAQTMRTKFLSGHDEVKARQLVLDEPGLAPTLIASEKQFPFLQPDDRQRLVEYATHVAEADARQRIAEIERNDALATSQEARANAWLAVDTERGLKDGSKGLRDIEALRQDGKLTPSQADSLYTTWESQNKAQISAAQESARVSGAIGGTGPALDPHSDRDRKAVDAYWSAQVSAIADAAAGDPQAQQQIGAKTQAAAVSITAKTGIIPPALVGQLSGAMRGSADQRTWAAQTIAQLDTASPAAVDDLPHDTVRSARMTQSYLEAGLSPNDAAGKVDQALAVTDPVRKLRETTLTAGGQNSIASSAWTWARSSSGLRRDQGWLSFGSQGLDDRATPVRADFETFFRDAYVATGDEKAAREEAAGMVRKRWSVSKIGGSAQWMRYAPEAVYAPADPDASTWMRGQLQMDAGDTAFVVSDPQTALMIATGEQPTYSVFTRDPKTGVIDAVRGQDGRPARWRPDAASYQQQSHQQALDAANADRSRAVPYLQNPPGSTFEPY